MDIKHRSGSSKGEFFIQDDGDKKAQLTYSKMEDRGIIIDHTEVAKELRGRDIGKRLVKQAVQFARQHNLRVIPTCPYAEAVIKRNPSLKDVLR